MSDPLALDAAALARRIAARALSAREVVEASLARAAEVQARLNPFTIILADEALAAAEAADRAMAEGGPLGALHGVPFALKDMTPSAGHPTTLGSLATGDGITAHDAEIVARLRKAGGILLAKTTTPEFAWSSFTRSPRYGPTGNPFDPARSAGGSSGGSAVAVATGVVPLAEGTDMGGSVRIPAAFCGVVGFKPSLGRIPMTILPTAFDDMSHFGSLTRSVADAVLFTSVTAGAHAGDARSFRPAFDAATAAPSDVAGLRLAYSADLGFFAVDRGVRQVVEAALGRLAASGAEIVPVALPWTRAVHDAWLAWWGVFLASQFSGHWRGREDLLDPPLRELIARGEAMGAVAYRDIERTRTAIWRDLMAVFAWANALVLPTCAIPPPLNNVPEEMFDRSLPDGRLAGLDMTSPFNLASPCPAISLPCGFTPGPLPVGLQIVGPPQADERLLAIAGGVERVLGKGVGRDAT